MDLRTKEKEWAETLAVHNHSEKGFNYLIGEPLDDSLMNTVFGEDAHIEVRPADFDMFDILVEIGAWKSRGECKRNWKKSDGVIEHGCHSFLVFKKDKPLFIFKPIP